MNQLDFDFAAALFGLIFPGATGSMSIPDVLSESLNWYQYAYDEECTSMLNGSSLFPSGDGMGVGESCN